MKNKIHKILGVGLTLVIAMALVMGFVAPVAAAETINEWYKFEYPVPGEDGDWLYDPSIWRIGEITEAIDGTLYVHVQRVLDADPTDPDPDPFYFDIDSGTLTQTQSPYDGPDGDPWNMTGTIAVDLVGTWDGPETDFVAWCAVSFPSMGDGTHYGSICISGTVTATTLTFSGSIEYLAESFWLASGTWDVDGDSLSVCPGGFGVFAGTLDLDGPDDVTIDGVTNIGSFIFKSTDGARTWEDTEFPGGWVADMAASSIDADTLYVADGYYVYKTDDAGDTWDYVSKDSLEEQLSGVCGVPACCYCSDSCADGPGYPFTCPITSIDVGYDDDDNPYVFIGTRKHCSGVDLDDDGSFDSFPGEVYWIGEAGYPSTWSGLGLYCYSTGDYDALAVGCAPDWADSHQTYVVVSNGSETHVVYTTGGPCDWPEVTELLYNCKVGNDFGSSYASRIAFPDDWEDTETLFVGVVDCDYCEHNGVELAPFLGGDGGDVYMVTVTSPTTPAIDMNVAGILTGCVGIKPVDIISLDIEGDTDEASLIAGSFCCNEVYYSYDGGWDWDASEKDPTGGGLLGYGPTLTYAIWYEDTALAVTSGCECAVSMSCVSDDVEDVGEAWIQISLMATGIECVRSIDHSPGYVCGDSETMFMLTSWDPDFDCCFPCMPDPGDTFHRCYDYTQSVWRYDGTYWERVYCSVIAGSENTVGDGRNIFWMLQVSPDFNDTNVVYLWNDCFEMWRTTDAGCSWDKLTFPCAPRDCIHAAVVIDEDTVIAGGMCCHPCCVDAQGYVYKTTRHGARPWDEYEYETVDPGDVVSFALEPGYDDPGYVLLGDDMSRVYISEDGGEEWDLVGAGTTTGCEAILTGTNDTYVIFDPGYPTNNTIYAAAGDIIARCTIDTDKTWAKQEWVVLCDHAGNAAGIKAAGDTALYVTDSVTAAAELGVVTTTGSVTILGMESYSRTTATIGTVVVTVLTGTFIDGEVLNVTGSALTAGSSTEVSGTIQVEGAASGASGTISVTFTGLSGFTTGETVRLDGSDLTATAPVTAGAAIGGVLRSLNPLDDVKPTMKVVFERIATGLLVDADPAQLRGLWLTCGTSEDGCAENVLWALDSSTKDPPTLTGCENIWVYEDTLAQPVVLDMPIDAQKLTTTTEITLSWEELCGADCYEVSLWKYCPECPDEKLAVDLSELAAMDCCPYDDVVCGPELECPDDVCTEDICIVVDGLESGCTYYWQVRVCQGKPTLSKWSEERSFMTALLAVPFADLCSPDCGSQDIILTPNFAWGPVTGATGYDIELATTETFTAGVVKGSSTVNAWVLSAPLDYATTYYWRVRAEKDGVYSAWTVCMFTTMAKAVAPPPPVTITPAPPAPQINIPPAQMITPNWIYAIIAIGAALCVVVIVLIVRTRRPPA